ncbi:hypothetical protein I6I06_08430 [Paraburkholderia ginsengisoli]|uniref:Uncharacterized protein n=1 Tax=Paraburkholderia ginsengisoli TaxID=311231 RepID=A0A7T4N5H0_9BURK|nr:hypothetical protein I6I06_08430 [Paraburkholderia ginsengisoli]
MSLELADRQLRSVRHRVIRNAGGIFAHQTALVRADRIEVARAIGQLFGVPYIVADTPTANCLTLRPPITPSNASRLPTLLL